MVLTGPVIRRRLAACMLAIFFALFLTLSARLFQLAGASSAEELQRRAQAQWTSESADPPHARRNPTIETAQVLAHERHRLYRSRASPTADIRLPRALRAMCSRP